VLPCPKHTAIITCTVHYEGQIKTMNYSPST
jgi:hypothetical protein